MNFRKGFSKAKRVLGKIKTWALENKKQAIMLGVVAFILFVGVDEAIFDKNKPKQVGYKEFVSDLKDGDIDCIYYDSDEETMRYTLHNKTTRGMTLEERDEYKHKDSEWRMTTYPAGENFRKEALSHGTKVKLKIFEPVSEVIISLIFSLGVPILLFVLIYRAVISKIGNAGELDTDTIIKHSDVRFSDVLGLDEIIDDLQFIVSLMKDEVRSNTIGAKIPKGILFTGEPGTGKTLLAKAVAGESGVPFLYMNASGFIEIFAGTGAKRVRALFAKARALAPCIVFIDEIDAIGCKRDRRGANSEDRQTLNALLQEMDGFDTKSGVFVIAATNTAAELDAALVRAGRFDRKIVVSPPKNWEARKKFFLHFTEGVECSFDVDNISKQTTGFTGADIEAVVNEAKLIAIAHGRTVLTGAMMEEALDKHLFKGNRARGAKRDKDKELVAYHEAGHAAMNYLLKLPIARASIIGSTSGVGGSVIPAETDTQFETRVEFLERVMVGYAGRCSEQIKFSEVTTGAGSDITNTTKLLKSYVERNGFSSEIGMIDIAVLKEGGLLTDDLVLRVVLKLSKDLLTATTELLRLNYEIVERIAQQLLLYETLTGEEIEQALKGYGVKTLSQYEVAELLGRNGGIK